MFPPSDHPPDPGPGLLSPIDALFRADEGECLRRLVPLARLAAPERDAAADRAARWIEGMRRSRKADAGLADLLSRFSLTSQEGLALMCLAEALLRIPDAATADALIRDKLGEAHWNEVLGNGNDWALNATGWALALTGFVTRLDDPARRGSPGAALSRLMARLGQPILREALRHAMQWLAARFVMGEAIDGALRRAQPRMDHGVRYSFDMLGEGARTAKAAERYFEDYKSAIDSIGHFHKRYPTGRPSGISVKLSALHPRYEWAQRDRVLRELGPRLAALCELAARHGIPLTVDAEEADRLYLALDIIGGVLGHAALDGWEGLGFAVQAYEKRAPAVIGWYQEQARAHRRRLHIRLVKGAYWDTEIKRAQERGWSDFPVYTRKAGTDVSYLACARKLLEDQGGWVKPVFGTHNALTASHVIELAGRDPSRLEFQRLHGMGEELHGVLEREGYACCVYAPVGGHEVLLGYLVRRILENGANSSFVHRLMDRDVPVEELTKDPADEIEALPSVRDPSIRRPSDLFMPERRNSSGLDLADPFVTKPLLDEMEAYDKRTFDPAPDAGERGTSPPAGSGIGGIWAGAVGLRAVQGGTQDTLARAFDLARDGFAAWSATPVERRAACLEKLAELLERDRSMLMALLIREGGKTIPDALAEAREAADFCLYYAARARVDFQDTVLPGPEGERNRLRLKGRGVFACISPWNFPLAIFLGQIAAALAAGNAVVAKPAPQTPGIALAATRLIYEAGVPQEAFRLVTGGAETGAALVAHPDVAGVAFTGSFATAQAINRTLAAKDGPIVPLIAETGGQNAMIVDTSALPEQVVDDVIISAFRSAGQRCSALRVLFVPQATADKILSTLAGAMAELRVGEPMRLETDIGPVIDEAARQKLLAHVERLKREAKEIFTLPLDPDACGRGSFVAPQAWEIPSIGWLDGEVFGPILHVVRYRGEGLGELIAQVNATGFGLTAGLHSRIASFATVAERDFRAGNLYVNRSMIGAVVGSQPFGGEGLSGTGPKAGGPRYLPRFAREQAISANTAAAGGNASLIGRTLMPNDQ